MKRFLSAALCIILVAALLCSCGESKAKKNENEFLGKVTENPTATLFGLVKETTKNFAPENEAMDIVLSALNKGTTTFEISAPEMIDGAMTFYRDSTANKWAYVASAKPFYDSAMLPSEGADIGLYANGSEVIIKSDAFLSEDVYGVDFKTLYDDLANWGIWSEYGVSFEDLDEEAMEPIKLACDLFGNIEETKLSTKAELLKLVKQIDKYASVKEVDKDGVKAVVVTYDLKTEDFKELLNMVFDLVKQNSEKLGLSDEEMEEINEYLNAETYLEDQYIKEIDLSLSVYVNKDTKDIMKVDFSAGRTEEWVSYYDDEDEDAPEEERYSLEFSFDFGAGIKSFNKGEFKISVVDGMSYDGEEYRTDLSGNVVKTVSDGKEEYKVTMTSGEETGYFVYSKSVSADAVEYSVELFLEGEEDEPELSVLLTVNKKDGSFAFYSEEGGSGGCDVAGVFAQDASSFSVTIANFSTRYTSFVYPEDFEDGDEREETQHIEEIIGPEGDVSEIKVTFVKDGKIDFPADYTKFTDITREKLDEWLSEKGEFEDLFSSLFVVNNYQ